MMKWFSVFVALLAALSLARAQGPDDQYLRIYSLIQEADSLAKNQPAPALEKYLEAQAALRTLQQVYPEWNSKVITFRLNYVASQIDTLAPKRPPPSPATASNPKPSTPLNATFALPPRPAPPPPSELENQVNSLKDQIRQMQADKILMEAKLKEALAAQPAALDPRELAKAEEKIKALQKESDLLKVTLTNEKAKKAATPPAPAPDTHLVQQLQQEVTDANRKLAAQTERANSLAAEKKNLQAKLDSIAPTTWNAAALEVTKKALEDANRQLAQQKDLNLKLSTEKDVLQTRLKNAGTDTTALDALRAENTLLKKQLADLRSASPTVGKAQESNQKVVQYQAQLAALQSEKDILRLEKLALEGRYRQLATAAPKVPAVQPAASTPIAIGRPEDAARIKQLEQERDDLLKKLEGANKEPSAVDRKSAERVDELNLQLTALRARLEVFEARRVPYTPEELALFNRTEPLLTDTPGGKKSVRELPAGTAALVAEAERYFTAKQLDKAKEKYLEVIARDDKNAPALANLATIEIELHQLDDAEKHIVKAATLAPDDAYTLSILGYLRFMQQKYDDAVDALSRAATIDPDNAQVQNYLGITLSEKGLRVPAENALRKAVQLQPNYGSAHHNLAVIYVTQRPPAVELARWHYKKAIDSGHPKNPNLEKMLEGTKTASNGQ